MTHTTSGGGAVDAKHRRSLPQDMSTPPLHLSRTRLPSRPSRAAVARYAAHALLVVLAATEHIHAPAPAGLIALTCNEIRRLFAIYVIEPGRARACPNARSHWRRRHQHRARTSHYQHQEAAQT
jgi:hypothetical protein